MQTLFLKLISIGVNSNDCKDTVEKIKLVNGISLVGVPVCFLYAAWFGLTGNYFHALTFTVGLFVFAATVAFNQFLGLNFARRYISVMAPLCFGFVNLISGKEAGFYMGFIVTTTPALLVFNNIKESFFFIGLSLVILALSIIGMWYIPPVNTISFCSSILLVNLFTVIVATLTVVFLFKKELNESKAKIEQKQEEILDSIHYAKRIQNTLITNKDFIAQYLPNNFIYFQPKDIVSGDFYWATKNGNKFYLAVCDSTGHGVPGAFMSLLNITFLNEAINQNNILKPDEIFNYTRKRLIENLGKDGQKDGFDGILLCIDLDSKSMSYAAANNSPIVVSNGKSVKLPCDKMPVGQGERTSEFTLNSIELKPNDILYLYTDGFADQFGGLRGKKYKYKQLNDLLELNSKCNLDTQREVLKKEFASWKGNLEQVDDVCIIGIRF